jgi:pyruvate/2-oxoglutarate dehydrogenase complex dihydrolipoamide dehydrogenase (E3) component
MEDFDAIVIGSGQAGPFLGARLAAAGKRVALIEREHLGGTCVNEGCMPTKTMVASARAAHMARRAADFGVHAGPVTVDMAAVIARKDAAVQGATGNLAKWLGGMANMTVIWGDARFTAPRTIAVAGRELRGEQVFINTGGRPVVPDWPGLDRTPYFTSTTIMQATALPDHLLVAGGSYIGLEFAQMYRRFGARVTVLEAADDIVMREDEDIRAALRGILEAEGITIRTGVRDIAVEPAGGGVLLRAQQGGTAFSENASALLVAVGRRPNTDTLGLDAAGIKTDARGYITVDDTLRTSADSVWALGDVNGRGAFTHTSYHDHEIVADTLLSGRARSVAGRIMAYALFTDPPLARIGMSETDARRSGRPVLRGVLPMSRVGRAKERSETAGLMKVLVCGETRRILGAALLGIEADEAIHVLLHAMAAGVTVQQFCDVMPIHPTVSELLPTLLGDLRPL